MTEIEPNDEQEELIEGTEGVYLVDAGAGTGKTFAITRRYAEIIDKPDVEPEDTLLVTFTRSAATEMKERIVRESSYSMRELADAPISTFHAHCLDILREHGYSAPAHLGLEEPITDTSRIMEDSLVEGELFREFLDGFRDDHPEHADVLRVASDPSELLGLINELASKGIFPTADGWYRDGEEALDGEYDEFKRLWDEANEPRNDGSKQSKLRKSLNEYDNDSKTYLSDAPEKNEIRGGRGTKSVDDEIARRVFEENRESLKSFVHDLYYEYLAFALSRNYLNMGFLQLFAFVLLCENDRLRDRLSYEYVMVDEFQDTSEIQFKLALLLADTDNFCVVGDWKQSIYAFQYADVDNIREFEDRLGRFVEELNSDRERVGMHTSDVNRVEFKENYRSTETVLDFSENALVTPAKSSEEIDEQEILDGVVSLNSNAEFDNTRIDARKHEDEHEAVLDKIDEIVDNDEYAVEDEDGEPRAPEYGDIAVLTRTRDFGRELLSVADEHGFPVAYDGGVELFRTDPAKLLLAWLRILEYDSDRGWAVVLERAGYTFDEMDRMLETGEYPSDMTEFRDGLDALESVGSVARRVFEKYGAQDEYADVILHLIQSLHDSSTLTRGDLIRLVERGIENGSTHDVSTSTDDDSVTVQTIHSAKGLEYPIVLLANMNHGKFPPRASDTEAVQYTEPMGVRQTEIYSEEGEHPHVYDSWKYNVYKHCLPDGYDEERRLLYVAVTRAESHVCFIGGENPNTFLEELPVDVEEPEIDVSPARPEERVQSQLPFAVTPPEGPTGRTPHSLMRDDVFSDEDEGVTEAGELDRTEERERGTDFGSRVHEFAERYALGEDVTPSNEHEERVSEFIDGLEGELYVEEDVTLPLTVDGDRYTVSGVADLVHVSGDNVEVVDYKTDQSRRAHDEYRKQASVYYHVVRDAFPGKAVSTSLFYTEDNELVTVDPIGLAELERLVRES